MTGLRISLLVLLVAACPGKGQQPATGGEKLPPKRVVIGWGFQPEGEMTDVFLATTDETGKQVSHPLGRYKGTCTKIAPAKEMNAISGAACTTGGGGTELHAVVQNDQILVLQMGTTPGTTPDPMAREQVKQIGFPLGAAVEVAP
jgi:hypothetical protein